MFKNVLLNFSSKKIVVERGFHIVSTPIGNISDITLRAIKTLDNSEVIVCEDTRVTKKLFKLLGLNTKNKNRLPTLYAAGNNTALVQNNNSPLDASRPWS